MATTPRTGMDVLERLAEALRSDTDVDSDHHRLDVSVDGNGIATLRGELRSMRAKRRAVTLASKVEGIGKVIDRLTVTPAAPVEDGRIRDHVTRALLEDPAFLECTVSELRGGNVEVLRTPPGARGEILVRVDEGVVTLAGSVPSLAHRRLAVVLAWWMPGTRNVVADGLYVSAPEEDTDDEITDFVRIVAEKHAAVTTPITLTTKDHVVTLEGYVHSDAERAMRERDAWLVEGVEDVVSHLEILH